MQIQTKGEELGRFVHPIKAEKCERQKAEQCNDNEDQKCVLFLRFGCQRNKTCYGLQSMICHLLIYKCRI